MKTDNLPTMDNHAALAGPLKLENPVQDYAWGSKTAIQEILGIETDCLTPAAELWMGAHPKAPSQVLINDAKIRLNDLIQKYPEAVLGADTAGEYDNTLPYLFKVLAADRPLSLQAHPDARQAKKGFVRENCQKIPISAPNRNYRDPWPKPELICAIEPFGALIGFRSPDAICALARQFCPGTLDREIRALAAQPDASGVRAFFRDLITAKRPRRAEIINEALVQAKNTDSPEAQWIARLYQAYPGDTGIIAPIYLNLLEISPGRAVYLAPGVMHAYLYGVGMEIMANSDNVLRGGLTGKHVDVAELLNVLNFAPGFSEIPALQPVNDMEQKYITPAKEFFLSVIDLEPGKVYQGPAGHSAEILFCLRGEAEVRKTGTGISIPLTRGASVLVPAAAGTCELAGNARIFKAGVP